MFVDEYTYKELLRVLTSGKLGEKNIKTVTYEEIQGTKNEKELNDKGVYIEYNVNDHYQTTINSELEKQNIDIITLSQMINFSHPNTTIKKYTEEPLNISVFEALRVADILKCSVEELFKMPEKNFFYMKNDGDLIYIDLKDFTMVKRREQWDRRKEDNNYFDRKNNKAISKKEYDENYVKLVTNRYSAELKKVNKRRDMVLREKIYKEFSERFCTRFCKLYVIENPENEN